MDVHPPHKAIESWREFFVHLFTITIGLLIALGLEGIVEWSHHRHLVHEAHTNLRQELVENQRQLGQNLAYIQQDEKRMQQNLQLLSSLRETHSLPKGSTLEYKFSWSDFSDSAWKSARDTGALEYMDYKEVQHYADVYGQQEISDSAATALFHEQTMSASPIFIYGDKVDPEKLRPAEVDLILQRTADVLMNLKELEQVTQELGQQYDKALREM